MISEWIDKNGLIKPRKDWDSSGNGFLYTQILMCLDENYYNQKVTSLWNRERQVLMRAPDNSYGQQSHDDYLALAVYCLMFNKRWARACIFSFIKKFGFMQNDFKERGAFWSSQMIRFPHVWVIMLAAAYPLNIVRLLAGCVLRAINMFDRMNLTDASGIQLQWLKNYALCLLGHKKSLTNFYLSLRSNNTSMKDVMIGYFDFDHPILSGYENHEAVTIWEWATGRSLTK